MVISLPLRYWPLSFEQIEKFAEVGFADVSFVVSAAVVGVNMGLLFLCRGEEDTWRDRGSGKGLVVVIGFDYRVYVGGKCSEWVLLLGH